jgi:glycosyltransferase involved in cell wall biosynthesis
VVGRQDNGLEVYAVKLARAMSAVPAVRVHVCTVDRDDRGGDPDSAEPSGVELQRFGRWQRVPNLARRVSSRLGPGRVRALVERLEAPGISFGLARHLAGRQADIVIAVGVYPLTTVQCLLQRAVRFGPPVVLAGLLHLDSSGRISAQHRASLRLCDGYVALTDAEADVARRSVRPGRPVVVIPPPHQQPAEHIERSAARAALGLPAEGVLVGFVGRLTWAKDLRVLLEAFALLGDRVENVGLLLAGSTTADTDELRAAVAESTVGERVHVRADFMSSDVTLIYGALDIFVNPSRLESFGMVFVDAWSYGLPVVGARIPAIADVLASGERGLLFDPGDPTSLAEALERLSTSVALRSELGETGRAAAGQLYGNEAVTGRLVELVRRVRGG